MNKRDYLYSPWRLSYVAGEKEEGCVLCRHLDPGKDQQHLIVKRFEHCYVMLNLYPYNNGHIMVVPYAHKSSLVDLEPVVRSELIEVMSIAEKILRELYSCDGINIGLNLGKAAGAGIDEHLHFHLVPRWAGDSNFLSVIAGERVIPESFESALQRLAEAFRKV
jgi:ATP adenylyltransferase